MDFVNKIEQLLNDRGISGRKMQEDLGLSSAAISSWKRRDTIPGGETIIALCKYFDVSADYLLGIEKKTPIYADEGLTEIQKQAIQLCKSLPDDTLLHLVQLFKP